MFIFCLTIRAFNIDYIINKIVKLIKAINILDLKVYHTEQNPEKLGPTNQLIRILIDSSAYPKMTFSCVSCKDLILELRNKNNLQFKKTLPVTTIKIKYVY